jgi:hypothetical protein
MSDLTTLSSLVEGCCAMLLWQQERAVAVEKARGVAAYIADREGQSGCEGREQGRTQLSFCADPMGTIERYGLIAAHCASEIQKLSAMIPVLRGILNRGAAFGSTGYRF